MMIGKSMQAFGLIAVAACHAAESARTENIDGGVSTSALSGNVLKFASQPGCTTPMPMNCPQPSRQDLFIPGCVKTEKVQPCGKCPTYRCAGVVVSCPEISCAVEGPPKKLCEGGGRWVNVAVKRDDGCQSCPKFECQAICPRLICPSFIKPPAETCPKGSWQKEMRQLFSSDGCPTCQRYQCKKKGKPPCKKIACLPPPPAEKCRDGVWTPTQELDDEGECPTCPKYKCVLEPSSCPRVGCMVPPKDECLNGNWVAYPQRSPTRDGEDCFDACPVCPKFRCVEAEEEAEPSCPQLSCPRPLNETCANGEVWEAIISWKDDDSESIMPDCPSCPKFRCKPCPQPKCKGPPPPDKCRDGKWEHVDHHHEYDDEEGVCRGCPEYVCVPRCPPRIAMACRTPPRGECPNGKWKRIAQKDKDGCWQCPGFKCVKSACKPLDKCPAKPMPPADECKGGSWRLIKQRDDATGCHLCPRYKCHLERPPVCPRFTCDLAVECPDKAHPTPVPYLPVLDPATGCPDGCPIVRKCTDPQTDEGTAASGLMVALAEGRGAANYESLIQNSVDSGIELFEQVDKDDDISFSNDGADEVSSSNGAPRPSPCAALTHPIAALATIAALSLHRPGSFFY